MINSGTLRLMLLITPVFLPPSPASAPPPLSSLRLLVPPLRLLTAAMWQVARRKSVKHYGMLEDFVCLLTEAVPQLLTDRQRSLLLLALRAKVCTQTPLLMCNNSFNKLHTRDVPIKALWPRC